jgi:inner membrane protease subunit 1
VAEHSGGSEAFSRAFLVAQAVYTVHIVDHHICSIAFVRGPACCRLPAINLASDVVAMDKLSVRRGRVPRWARRRMD